MIELIIYFYLGVNFSIWLTLNDHRFINTNFSELALISFIYPIIIFLITLEKITERFSDAEDRISKMP
jgi:hypothetical protein